MPEFGKINIADLQMKECAFEKDAPAMQLIKYEEVNFTSSYTTSYKIKTQKRFCIKIFNEKAFKYANVVLRYSNADRDFKIGDLEGATYNLDENGQIKISRLNSDEIFRDKGKKKGDFNALRFTFPDVKPGCIIEYRYTTTEKESYFIAPWYFQDNIPTLFAACKINIPYYSSLEKRFVGSLPVEQGSEVDESKGFEQRTLQQSFTVRNINSFASEPFMSSANDYKQRVEFLLNPYETFYEATIKNSDAAWQHINTQLLSSYYFGWQFNRSIGGIEAFIDSATKLKTTADKVNAVYQYVKKNVEWDEYYSVYAGDLDEVWKNKEGSSAEINLTILNLLRKIHVPCYPIIFSTRQHGKTDYKFPNLRQFNSVDILIIDGDMFYILDGTAKYQPFNIPPFNILSRDAFIVDYQNAKWVNIVDPRKLFRDSIAVSGTIDKDGTLKGVIVNTYYDLAKTEKIENENNEEDDDEKTIAVSDLKIDSVFTINKTEELLPLIETTRFHYSLPSTGDFYFLNPFLFSNLSDNPFKDSARKSEIDFGANGLYTIHMEITLAPEIKMEEMMENKLIATPDSSMQFNCISVFKNDTIVVNNRFEINRAVFKQEEYPMIRRFFRDVYSLSNSQILLKTKN